jgi:hypothetical protein
LLFLSELFASSSFIIILLLALALESIVRLFCGKDNDEFVLSLLDEELLEVVVVEEGELISNNFLRKKPV